MPVLLCASVQKAFAAEAVAITLDAPFSNQRDKKAPDSKATGMLGKQLRAPRKRPSSWRRHRGVPWVSILKNPWVHRQLGKPIAKPDEVLQQSRFRALAAELPFAAEAGLRRRCGRSFGSVCPCAVWIALSFLCRAPAYYSAAVVGSVRVGQVASFDAGTFAEIYSCEIAPDCGTADRGLLAS